MLDFNERMERCVEDLDKRINSYLDLAEQADSGGDAIMALKYGAVAQGMSEALYAVRRARVPETLRPIIEKLLAESKGERHLQAVDQ